MRITHRTRNVTSAGLIEASATRNTTSASITRTKPRGAGSGRRIAATGRVYNTARAGGSIGRSLVCGAGASEAYSTTRRIASTTRGVGSTC